MVTIFVAITHLLSLTLQLLCANRLRKPIQISSSIIMFTERKLPGTSPDARGFSGAVESDAGAAAIPRSVCGEFTLSHPDIALTEPIRKVPDATVLTEQVTPDSESRLLVFSVCGDQLDDFERTLERDETVSNVLVINRTPDNRSYRVEITDEAVAVVPALTRAGARVLDVVGSNGDWDVRAQFHSRQAFSSFRTYCSDNDITFRLHKLRWDDGESDLQLDCLTPDQRDVLQRAHEAGYFDVPRGISQAELADQFGISSSAVSQRLRRATSRLIEEQFGTDDA